MKDSELKLAKQLIDQGTTDTFEPAKYKDTVRERVLEAIQGKVEGHEITTEPAGMRNAMPSPVTSGVPPGTRPVMKFSGPYSPPTFQ